MADTRNYYNKAKVVLDALNNEKICSTNESIKNTGLNLNTVRTVTAQFAQGMIAPGLTACTATTLLKIGLCQELSQRYILEYCIQYKEQNFNIILTADENNLKENHAFVYVGKLNKVENLITGSGGSNCYISSRSAYQEISQFLDNNKEGVFVDPLMNCLGNSKQKLSPLLAYCSEHNIKYVTSVRCFQNTPGFIENANAIKNNARTIAQQLQACLSLRPNENNIKSNATKPGLFKPNPLDALIVKYELPDKTQSSIEKGLRNAASNNKISDLKIFIDHVDNINAKDANPKVGRTALHWAAIKGHQDCYQLLLNAKADPNIADVANKKASEYLASFTPSAKRP